MSKKRNCRMTPEERTIHERAVKVRKMTDNQIAGLMEELVEKGEKLGAQQKCEACSKNQVIGFITYLEDKVGSGNGIGCGVIQKLKDEYALAIEDKIFR